MKDLVAYNEQFLMSDVMDSMISPAFSRIEPNSDQTRDDQPSTTPLATLGREQSWNADSLQFKHRDVLREAGLALVERSGTRFTVVSAGEQLPNTELRISIANREVFCSILAGLTPPLAAEIAEPLEKLVKSLRIDIASRYDLGAPSGNELTGLASLSSIYTNLNRLGLTSAANSLSPFIQHIVEGTLKEHLTIERLRLLSKPGMNFGPGDWFRDATPQRFSELWNSALEALEEVKKNPRAVLLADKLATHLRYCVLHSSLELERSDSDKHPNDSKAGLRPTLADVRIRLDYLSSAGFDVLG